MTTMTDPLLGTVLSGRYRIDAPVARGGMAMVYRGTDLRLGRQVAVKVMHHHLLADDGFVDRFEREAMNAAKLSHPNLIAVHDQGRDGDAVYLVMEYLESVTLRKELRHRGLLTPRQAIVVIDAILAALEAVHSADMIHRDLKPDNVLLGTDGQIKLADFGLARAVSTATTTKTLIGTVGYVAPELVTRQGADSRTDLYTLGIMFYEMLTGKQPYTDEVPIQVAYRHVHDSVPPPSESRPGLSPHLDALVLWATSRDPEDRPGGATQMRLALGEARAEMSEAELDLGSPEATSGQHHAPVLTATMVIESDTDEVVGKEQKSRTDEIPFVASAEILTSEHSEATQDDSDHTSASAPTPAGASAAVDTDDEVTDLAKLRPTPVDHRVKRTHRARVIPGAGLVARGARAKRRNLSLLTAAAVLVCVLIGFGLVNAESPSVNVPSAMAGKDAQDVVSQISDAGLKTQTREVFDATVPAGKVISTNPAPGTSLAPDALVTIVVSKGEELFAVPTVSGKSLDGARKALEDAGLSVGEVKRQYHDSVADGKVISQSQQAGQKLSKGTGVNLNVSKGVAPLLVPAVKGWTYAAAFGKITRMGLLVAKEEEFSDTVAKGRVISQWPQPGKPKRAGDLVILKVSKGKKPEDKKPADDTKPAGDKPAGDKAAKAPAKN